MLTSKFLVSSFRVVLVSSTIASMLTACGSASFSRKDGKKAGKQEVAAGSNLGDCLKLALAGDMPEYGQPQDSGYDKGAGGGDVVIVPGYEPAKPGQTPTYPGQNPTNPPVAGYEPGQEPIPGTPGYVPGKEPGQPYTPGQNPTVPGYEPGKEPGQPYTPGQNPEVPGKEPGKEPFPGGQEPLPGYEDGKGGKDGGKPYVPTAPCKPTGKDDGKKDDGKGPSQGGKDYPAQTPIDPSLCGKDGKFCDDGKGPGQYPGQTSTGKSYDQKDAEGCFAAFRNAGYDTKGMWNIVVKEAKSVNVLSHSTFTDVGNEPALVIIKSVNVLGSMDYELLNPNALYCIKSVSVLQNTNVTSCLESNVVFGKDVSVLSGAKAQLANCGY